jgi:uncharacterized repeat protein (TIGR03803 family)
MEDTMHYQGTICGVRVRALSAALAVVIALVPEVLNTRPAQAPTEPPGASAATYTILYAFTGGADGGTPTNGVVRDAVGNLYGTTQFGGLRGCAGYCGVVFKLDTTGKETVLHSFTGNRGGDGENPYGGVIRDPAGNLYGTTTAPGTVFEVDATGKETILHRLAGASGQAPYASLIRDAEGNLYGTTRFGGGVQDDGVVFKLAPTPSGWRETVLHRFLGYPSDGANPIAGLIRDKAGSSYGTTTSGGSGLCTNPGGTTPSGCGAVFKVDATGNETVLHSFVGYPADGAFPYGRLVGDKELNLYGTTFAGGDFGDGAVFKLDKTGNETILYSFTGGADGANPTGGLVRDAAGNLYGTTTAGGSSACPFDAGCGVVFELDTTGSLTVLHSFDGADGTAPTGTLWRDTLGNLYGVASSGGASDAGVVFKITP